jgi:ssDNA-binding Zn-finger/Zn-ribbon topoisomerase 1
MRLHLLAPDVKCPACGAGLTFIRSRGGHSDVYQCASGGRCKCQILHYRSKRAKACGYAVVHRYGEFGKWTACGETAAKGE